MCNTIATSTLPQLLPEVVALAREAGKRLAAEFARLAGPRGGGDKAPIDSELEEMLRAGLVRILAAPVIGEELPNGSTQGASRLWLLDPHDGTSAFLQGYPGQRGLGRAARPRGAGAGRGLRASLAGPGR